MVAALLEGAGAGVEAGGGEGLLLFWPSKLTEEMPEAGGGGGGGGGAASSANWNKLIIKAGQMAKTCVAHLKATSSISSGSSTIICEILFGLKPHALIHSLLVGA